MACEIESVCLLIASIDESVLLANSWPFVMESCKTFELFAIFDILFSLFVIFMLSSSIEAAVSSKETACAVLEVFKVFVISLRFLELSFNLFPFFKLTCNIDVVEIPRAFTSS